MAENATLLKENPSYISPSVAPTQFNSNPIYRKIYADKLAEQQQEAM